ncbi:MAG: aminoacyl-tRNA hydrolase [Helicobacteraceae bacterium]|nr:aminoacyl-tRNA hydrolase [Helicobacteraceae bacterium]
MILIAGLGNPGEKYLLTRHNAGFLAADRLIARLAALNTTKREFKGALFMARNSAAIAEFKTVFGSDFGDFRDDDLLILKPETFMNLSGESVIAVKNFYKPSKIIVIHDELDLPFGALRFKNGGGAGGHNGLKSIDAAIGNDYLRARMGISRPSGDQADQVAGLDRAFDADRGAANYVLSEWRADEREKLSDFADRAANAALALALAPLNFAQTTLTFKGY